MFQVVRCNRRRDHQYLIDIDSEVRYISEYEMTNHAAGSSCYVWSHLPGVGFDGLFVCPLCNCDTELVRVWDLAGGERLLAHSALRQSVRVWRAEREAARRFVSRQVNSCSPNTANLSRAR